jgi:hypothetical protein
VVGVVEDPAAVDLHGWAAWLVVERDLARDAEPTPPERVRIAWEELAPGRPPRFRAGGRVAVALAPMPGYSLWLERFPKADVLAVAESGSAFLRDPDPATLDGLARWVRAPAAEREESPGVDALSALVAGAQAPISEAAVARLGKIGGLERKLREPAAAELGRAMASPSRPETLRLAVVELAGAHRLDRLRPALAAVAQPGTGPLAGPAWDAIAAIDGGLPYPTARQLAASPDAGVRAVGVRFLVGTPDDAEVARRAARDPSAAVRIAATRALLKARGAGALEVGLAALLDPEPDVRAEIAPEVGALGPDVVPRLRSLAETLAGERASGPLAALAYAGRPGRAALLELSRTHPDEQTRGLALLMLGRDPRGPGAQ